MGKTIQALIETPKGSAYKYDYEQQSGNFSLKKQLPKGMVFPYDFGFIPGTVGQDGDPLDVILIAEHGTFTGCAVECLIIGALICEQTERNAKKMRNDRYLAIPLISGADQSLATITQLPKAVLEELKSFFITYNQLAGKTLVVKKTIGPKAALQLIESAKEKQLATIRLELLVPAAAPAGKKYPKAYYQELEKELTTRFGGLTAYSRAPVQGMWKPDKAMVTQPMIIYEVLLSELDLSYWTSLKATLESKFSQQEILITHGPIAKI